MKALSVVVKNRDVAAGCHRFLKLCDFASQKLCDRPSSLPPIDEVPPVPGLGDTFYENPLDYTFEVIKEHLLLWNDHDLIECVLSEERQSVGFTIVTPNGGKMVPSVHVEFRVCGEYATLEVIFTDYGDGYSTDFVTLLNESLTDELDGFESVKRVEREVFEESYSDVTELCTKFFDVLGCVNISSPQNVHSLISTIVTCFQANRMEIRFSPAELVIRVESLCKKTRAGINSVSFEEFALVWTTELSCTESGYVP